MTKKLKAFSHSLRSCEKEESGSFFRAKPGKMNHISPFCERSEQKAGQCLFCHVLSKKIHVTD